MFPDRHHCQGSFGKGTHEFGYSTMDHGNQTFTTEACFGFQERVANVLCARHMLFMERLDERKRV